MVAWIPKLAGDDLEDARAASRAFDAAGVPQYWDGKELLGDEVARALGTSAMGPAWDAYLFYPPDARWDEHLPPPSVVLAQMAGVVVANKGALPAHGDANVLPAALRDRADVVGEQPELPALLAAAARPFEH